MDASDPPNYVSNLIQKCWKTPGCRWARGNLPRIFLHFLIHFSHQSAPQIYYFSLYTSQLQYLTSVDPISVCSSYSKFSLSVDIALGLNGARGKLSAGGNPAFRLNLHNILGHDHKLGDPVLRFCRCTLFFSKPCLPQTL